VRSSDDVRAGAILIAVLAAAGALLGLLWQWWSPAGPIGLVISRGAIQPDETEAFVAGDGRFAVITAAVGLVAGLLAWRRRERRGPILALALGVGGMCGALLTEAVGHLVRGGSDAGAAGQLIEHLPLSVHASGLLFLEPAAALLVYGLYVAFANSDDLGRPETHAGAAVVEAYPGMAVGDPAAGPVTGAVPGAVPGNPGAGEATSGYSEPASSVD
jgi:uncharacterized protein DUF2567